MQSTAIIGLGSTGASIARFLQRRGEPCELFDEHARELPEELQQVPLHTGPLQAKLLSRFGRILVSPGVPWMHPALLKARAGGVEMHGDLDLFVQHCDCPVVAITGTNGKTTTTHMMSLLLETLPGGCEAGGNVGTPMLDLLQGPRTPARVVLELSSFQLERSSMLHPQWAVMLNIQPDHADMHATPEEYLAAKLRMFDHQGEGDTAMLPMEERWDELARKLEGRGVHVHRFGIVMQDELIGEALAAGICHEEGEARLFWHQDGNRQQIPCTKIPASGRHQHVNLAVAAQAAADFGVSAPIIREAITSFPGLAHRLRKIGTKMGRDWFDDSKATNPDAAAAALRSFERVTWICGGARKGLDLMPLLPDVQRHVGHALVIGKEPQSYAELLTEAGVPFEIVHTVDAAVSRAALLPEHAPVLLAPAAASLDQFRNYAERGDAFIKAVRALGDDV